MVGQIAPIYAVAGAIRRRQNGWHDEDKPLVFLFLVLCPVPSIIVIREVVVLEKLCWQNA